MANTVASPLSSPQVQHDLSSASTPASASASNPAHNEPPPLPQQPVTTMMAEESTSPPLRIAVDGDAAAGVSNVGASTSRLKLDTTEHISRSPIRPRSRSRSPPPGAKASEVEAAPTATAAAHLSNPVEAFPASSSLPIRSKSTPSSSSTSAAAAAAPMADTSFSSSPKTSTTSSAFTFTPPAFLNRPGLPHHGSSGTSASTSSGSHGLTSGLRSIAGAAAAAASPATSSHGAAAAAAQSRALSRSATTAGGMSLNGSAPLSSSLHGFSLQLQQQLQPPSILLNPLESGHTPSVVAFKTETKEGKIVTKIPAVPSEKDKAEERARIAREKERQREKEREAKEKEIQREREKEKVLWGILPKKALMMGMSDINFNAQVAILGGWGNGSGTQTIVPVVDRKREKEKEMERKRMEEMEQQLKREKEEEKKRKEAGASPDEPTEGGEDEILEPEELAAINAIINTRRSMEAAQALASGQVKMRRANSTSESVRMRRGRTSLSEASPEEVSAERRSPSASSSTPQRQDSSAADMSSSSLDSAVSPSSPAGSQQTPPAQQEQQQQQQLLRSAKIRFAALPSPYEDVLDGDDYLQQQQLREELPVHSALGAGLLSSGLLLGAVPFASDQAQARVSPEAEQYGDISASAAAGMSAESSLMRSEGSAQTMTGYPIDSANRGKGPSSIASAEISAEPSSASSVSESGLSTNKPSSLHSMRSAASSRGGKYMDRTDTMTTDGSEGSSEFGRWGKSKWYLMGMPAGLFKPGSYRGLLSQKRKSNRSEDSIHEALAAPLVRRLSTGTLGIMSSLEASRKSNAANSEESLVSSSSHRSHGVRAARQRPRSSRSRPSSRSGFVDEEERQRRRELILSARPGGTGMVTLLDGTKVKARRVDDPDLGEQDLSYDDWGYGLLAREARRSMAAERAEVPDDTEVEKELESSASPESPEEAESEALSIPLARVSSNSSSRRTPTNVTSKLEGLSELQRVTTGLGLTAERAEEIRRRHEEEVAALGWEVVHNAHKQQAKRQASISESTKTNGSEPTQDEPGKLNAMQEAANRRIASDATTRERPHSPRNVEDLRRVASRDSPTSSEPLQTPTHGRSRSASTSKLSPSSSWSRSEKAYMSMLPVDKTKMGDPSISIPAPSPFLPRKPDAKGHMVVPLPLQQLGRRPERPHEGRSWVSLDERLLAESPEPTDEDADETIIQHPKAEESDDEQEELNPEEQEEEERKTALQKKRATTRAAGQEVIQRKAKSPKAASKRHAHVPSVDDDDDSWWEPAKPKSLHSLTMSGSNPLRLSSSPSAESFRSARPSRQQSSSADTLRRSSSPRGLRSVKSTADVDQVDLQNLDDDAELWGPALYGFGVHGKHKDGEKRSKAAMIASQAQARAAREKRLREEKEEERQKRERMKNKEEHLDYGWPGSLKGSIY